MLRRYEAEDFEAVDEAAIASLDNIRPWMPNAARELEAGRERWVRFVRDEFDRGDAFPFGVFLLGAGTFVGHVGLSPDEDGFHVGYWMHVDHLRRGYAKEAVGRLIEQGWRSGARRFVIHCSPENAASMGVARTCGFTQVGTRTLSREGREYEEVRWELVARSS